MPRTAKVVNSETSQMTLEERLQAQLDKVTSAEAEVARIAGLMKEAKASHRSAFAAYQKTILEISKTAGPAALANLARNVVVQAPVEETEA